MRILEKEQRIKPKEIRRKMIDRLEYKLIQQKIERVKNPKDILCKAKLYHLEDREYFYDFRMKKRIS